MISMGRARLARALAIGGLALASVSVGCGDVDGVDGPAANEQTDPPPIAPIDARIAFTSTREGERYIYVATADGSQIRRLVRGERPTWSPDGRWIAFNASNGEISELRAIGVDGSGERVVASPGGMSAWSPDGTKLAVGHLSRRIGTMNADGSGLQLYPPALAFDPNWSPDGRSLLFKGFASPVGDSVSTVGSKMRIYVLDLQTLDVRRLIPDAIDQKNPSYRDDEPIWLRANKAPAVR
jgi:Tol biopolymer transport system component